MLLVATATVVAMLASASKPVTIEVRLADPRGGPASGDVVAEPVGFTAATTSRTVAAVGGSATISLEPGLWSVRARAERRWCAAAQVYIRDGIATPGAITLTLWPIGHLTGTLKAPPSESLPAHVTVRVHREVRPRDFGRARPLDSIQCPLAAARWSCEVPATMPLDLQIDAAPFAPRYLWQVFVAEGATKDVGAMALFRGASVAGFALNRTKPWQSHAVVQVTAPDGAPIQSPPGSSHGLSATTDEWGFFQVGPVPPGAYHVQASANAHVSEPAWVRLAADAEERLAEPLELVPPVTLRLQVDPPRDPRDRPWRIRLLTWRGQHSGHRLVKGESIADDGTWSRAGLPAGDNYRLSVASSDGDTWATRSLSLHGDSTFEHVVLEKLTVEGSVLMDTEPLTGRVQLKDESSRASTWFRLDESGDFSGPFPGVDLARARWVAQVESSAPSVQRTLTRLQPEVTAGSSLRFRLRLDRGVIEGTVVDESGAPQAAVVVEAREHALDSGEQSSSNELSVRTSGDGSFRIPGLALGEYRLVATGIGGAAGYESVSEVASVEVSGSRPASARLVLRSSRTLNGRVVTPAGTPVPGVTVFAFSPDSLEVSTRPRTTDADGRFDAKLPAGARQVLIVMWAKGVGRRVLGRLLPADGVVQVELNPFAGGQLLLELGQPEDDSSSVWIYHDGGIDRLTALAAWAEQNGSSDGAGVLRVPLLDPGTYRVCRLRGPFELGAFMSGTLPNDRCLSGELPPAGELQLQVPAPRS